MKNDTAPTRTFERLFALCSAALILSGLGLMALAGRPWLGGITCYVGATTLVLTFVRCAAILNRRLDGDEAT